jgi:hypothetical protein
VKKLLNANCSTSRKAKKNLLKIKKIKLKAEIAIDEFFRNKENDQSA